VSVQGLFERLVRALESAEVPYMVTGSYASSIHGMPRATRDIDIVIVPNREQLTRFIEQLPSTKYYASIDEAIEALRYRSQFNVIDFETGWKIDLIIPKLTEFSEEEFERRRPIDLQGLQLYVASPEDIFLAKLRWAKMGESERQIEDAAGVLSAQGAKLDLAYVERWVRKLELEAQYRMARERALPLT
jgi:hypothetical protein